MTYERKTDPTGKANPKYVDLLEEDKPISGQKFVCISFVSPDKILKQEEKFLFEEFLKKWDFQKSMEKFNQFLNFISFKYKFKLDDLVTDFKSFIEEERQELIKMTIEDDYKNFLDANEDDLKNKFNVIHNFQTTTRGIKVRGSYPTREEAELRCKMLREIDPNHNIFARLGYGYLGTPNHIKLDTLNIWKKN